MPRNRANRKLLLMLAVLAVFSMTAVAYAADALPFTDIEGHWAKDSIVSVAQRGIVKGHQDGTFRPDDPVTRGQMATFMDREYQEEMAPVEPHRGCTSCHQGKYTLKYEAVSRGGEVHSGLADDAGLNTCLGCHASGTGEREGKGNVAPIAMRDIVHPAHMGSKYFTKRYMGTCFTCHNVTSDAVWQVLPEAVETNDKGIPESVPIESAQNPS